ncbi:MAG TPA: dienelactone hydrolase family protein [Mycobacterium sp.]|nr:dienelactone hydrolase family protein [Mycobacterium sp.]
MTSTINVEGADTAMGLYEAPPQGQAQGAVVVIQEAFGVTEHIEDVCRRFAAEGYLAVAPHLFHRSGDPVIAYEEMEKVYPHVMALNAEGLAADIDAALRYLADAGFAPERTAVVGFCMGGSVAYWAGERQALGATVSFYGGGIAGGRFGIPPLVELAAELKTPWLGFFGDLDQTISVDEVESLRNATQLTKVPTEIVRYPAAEHGFHCDARSSYHEASAKDSWQQTLQWLKTHLAGR